MKQILIIVFIFISLIAGIKGATAPTLSVKDIDTQSLTDNGMTQTAIGVNTSIPSKTYLIELSGNYTISDITTSVIYKDRLNQYNSNDLYRDIPTSDDPYLYGNIESPISTDQPAKQSLKLFDEIVIEDIRYARVIFYPITYEDDGFSYHNREIEIYLGDSLLAVENLLSYEAVISNHTSKSENRNFVTGDLKTIYIIITTFDLAPSFEKLAQYKSSLGIKTEVRLLEDILPFQTGRDDAEKLREYLKQFYSEGGEFVLLGGDETKVPIRYAYHNIAYSTPGLDQQQICDLYFADLTGNWDADNDNVFGEKYADSIDIIPELNVGRLPFNNSQEVDNYIEKLITYETNPGGEDMSYLEKTFFVSTDQMRDYPGGGQHHLIARAYPDYFEVDTIHAVEAATGYDISPTNISANELESIISDGYGIINILSHGSNSVFGVRSSGYNEFPKSSFTTDTTHPGYGIVSNFYQNNKISFYYSLACDNASFDKDQEPFNQTAPNLTQTLLGLKDAGAVGFVAHTRWGWVSSSHHLQKLFFDSLFAHPNRPAIEAMYEMKQVYYYHRDQVLGINFFGDPTLKVYTSTPQKLTLSTSFENGGLIVNANEPGNTLSGCRIILSKDGVILKEGITNNSGRVKINYDFILNEDYIISALKDGYLAARKDFNPSISTGVDEINRGELPVSFALNQNYPNPFNPSTTISFELAKASAVTLKVFNVLGQQIITLVNEHLSAGAYQTEWNGTDYNNNKVASGVYFYRLEAEEYRDIKKMILLK